MARVDIINADVFEGLRQLSDESVHCVVTSPPYWGLRDYGTGKWEGGDPECDHLTPAAHGYAPFETSTLGPKRDGISAGNSAHANGVKRQQFKRTCGKCGAVKADRQIGQESTLADHIEVMTDVFREVRRVLRSDGTLWLNYGDAYNAGTSAKRGSGNSAVGGWNGSEVDGGARIKCEGLKTKDLMLMPSRLAIALQEDGWYVRSKIIWHKPNPMPESVTDRPTSAYEEILLLTKSGRYFYDADVVREPHAEDSIARVGRGRSNDHKWADGGPGNQTLATDISKACHPGGRNMRNVWTMATQPYKGAHFATFPQKLAETCIKAGCPKDGVVLDPFAGSGTTALVAGQLDRDSISIELNPSYCDLIRERIGKQADFFVDLPARKVA